MAMLRLALAQVNPTVGDLAGNAAIVREQAAAAVAAGADALLVEFHPDPAAALSDGEQALPLDTLPRFYDEVGRVAAALERGLSRRGRSSQ